MKLKDMRDGEINKLLQSTKIQVPATFRKALGNKIELKQMTSTLKTTLQHPVKSRTLLVR